MKKLISLLLIVLVLGAAFACTAWAEEFEGEEFAEPSYAYEEAEGEEFAEPLYGYKVDDPAIVEVVTAPTCYTTGVGKLANGQEVEIDATEAHNFVVFKEKSYPCLEDYEVTYKCTTEGCTATKVESNMLPVPHDWKIDKEQGHSDPETCEHNYNVIYKCSVCGNYKGQDGEPVTDWQNAVREEMPAKAHTFEGKEENYVYTSTESHPTCTKAGTAYDVCTKWGKRSEPITVPALGHLPYTDKDGKVKQDLLNDNYLIGTAKDDKGDATCASHSFQAYYCKQCAAKDEQGNYITDKQGHYMVEEGGRVVIYGTEELPDHKWKEGQKWTEVKPATCTEEGVASRTCKKCGTVETKAIPKLAHTPEVDKDGHPVPKILLAPTCEKEGKYTFVCTKCESEFVSADLTGWYPVSENEWRFFDENGVIEELGHKWETNAKYEPDDHGVRIWNVTKKATCTEDGSKQRTCVRCNKVETKAIPATGHEWNDWLMVVEPTDTSNGLWTRTCKHDGCKEVESYEAPKGKEPPYGYIFPAVTITKEGSWTNVQGYRNIQFNIENEGNSELKTWKITVTKDGAEWKGPDKWQGSIDSSGYGYVDLRLDKGVSGTFKIAVTITDNLDQTAEASITEVVDSSVKDGLVAEDGTLRAYKDGKIDTSVNGVVEFNGGQFLMKNGELDTSAEGLSKAEGSSDWYYCSYGQVHSDISQLVPYNGAWFFVTNGKLDRTKEGLVEYDGGKFIVSGGQVHSEYDGLWQDPATGSWAYYLGGQFWPYYSGPVVYDGATFQVKDGLLVG